MMRAVTELSEAVRAGDAQKVQHLLEREPKLASTRTPDGGSIVLLACTTGHRRVLDALLAAGPDLDVLDTAALGLVTRLEILLSLDPTLAGAQGPGGVTALHLAARFGHRAAVRRLLDAGADPDARDHAGATAADAAMAAGHDDLATVLRSP